MQEFEQKLQSIGFSKYESKVLIVLMLKSNMSATEIAKEAGIPRTSVYNILEKFVELGYCIEVKISGGFRYEAVDINILKSKMQYSMKSSFDSKVIALDTIVRNVLPRARLNKSDKKTKGIEIIKGYYPNRASIFLDMINNAKREILLMNRLLGNVEKKLDNSLKVFLKKGGVIKSIYETNSVFKIRTKREWKVATPLILLELCEFFQKMGEDIRLVDRLPLPILIVDREIVFESVKEDKSLFKENYDIIIRNPNYAQYMAEAFESYWKKAMSVEQFRKKINPHK